MRDDRELGELFSRLTRRVIEAERPLLERHGLTMWEYTVLARLSAGAAPSQLALAQRIGYDKTRLIALLDGLAARGIGHSGLYARFRSGRPPDDRLAG